MNFLYSRIPLWIGLRYMAAKRRNHFISFISASSMIGMTLGVAILILVLSVMNGFDRELRTRILGMVPHGVIYQAGGVQNWQALVQEIERFPGVEGAAPLVSLQGMFANNGRVHGVMVSGIDPLKEAQVSILPNHLKQGALDDLHAGEFGVILGELLARQLRARVGDKITLMLPEATFSPAGVLPRVRRLEVKGIFSVGAELDISTAVIHLEDAVKLGRIQGQAESIRVKFENLFDAPSKVWDIINVLEGDFRGSDWTRSQGNLFQAIKMEKMMIALLLMMLVAIAAFNIISTLVMAVTDKQADIAILRTMGAKPSTIMAIFMVQGCAIGVVGIMLGTALGVLGALTISDVIAWLEQVLGIQFLRADVYFISYFPSELKWSDVSMIVSVAFGLSFLATLYPSWRASKVQPAEALRYE